MRLPRLLVCTDRRAAARAGRSLVETVACVTAAGAPAVLFREKDLDPDARRALAEQLRPVLGDAILFVASDPSLAEHLDASGIHLASGDPRPASAGLRLGRSCHDRDGVECATGEDLDYVTVSPVAPTPSKPGYGPGLGIDGVARLAAVAGRMPVFALGGVRPAQVGALRSVGAYGVAVMGGVMAARDPAKVVGQLLDALVPPSAVPLPK